MLSLAQYQSMAVQLPRPSRRATRRGKERPMRPRGFWRVTVALLLASCCTALGLPTTAFASYAGFSDVESSEWYVTSGDLDYVLANGIMSGYGDGRFGPSDPVDRAQVATILWRLAGEPAAESETFPDADYSAFYGDALRWTRSTGVITGYPDGRFGPSDPVTREQLATMLYRYATIVANKNVNTDATALRKISGAADVSDFAWDAMAWAVNEGILTGDLSAGYARVLPQGTAIRSQMAKMTTVFNRDVLGNPGVDTGGFDPNSPTIAVFADDVIDLRDANVTSTVEGSIIRARILGASEELQEGDAVVLPESPELPLGGIVRIDSIDADESNPPGIWIKGGYVPASQAFTKFQLNDQFYLDDLKQALLKQTITSEIDGVSVKISNDGVNLQLDIDASENIKVSGSILIEDFYALAQYKKIRTPFGDMDGEDFFNVELETVFTPNLTLEVSALPQDLKKIQLVSVPIPSVSIPGTGTGIYLNCYLTIGVEGSISLSSTISLDSSAHKEPWEDMVASGNISTKGFDSLSVSMSAHTGSQAGIALQVAGYPIVDVGSEAGVAAKAESSFHPGLLCTDVKAWLYAECFAELLGESSLNLKLTQELMNESNSPFSSDFHFENGQLVPECTWENNPKRKAAQLFLDKIEELKATYGSPSYVTSSNVKLNKGLCYAELIDFGDGEERLLVAYCTVKNLSGFSDITSHGDYQFEIWEYDDGISNIKLSYKANANSTNGAFFYLLILQDSDLNTYILSDIYYTDFQNAEMAIGAMGDGSIGVVHTLEYSGAPGISGSYSLDGTIISPEQAQDFLSKLRAKRNASCYFIGQDTDAFVEGTYLSPLDCLRTVEKVTTELESRL